jgi:NADH-quinone oxidoreductase subunit D
VFLWALREREFFLDLNVKLCGQRLTTNYPRFGGVRNDMPYYFERDCMRAVDRFETMIWELVAMLDESSIFLSRMQNIGVISRKDAANYGITGPTMRGCGVDFDVRRDDPYCNYDQLDWEVAVCKDGDAYGRYKVRMEEMFQSCEIIRQAMAKLASIPKSQPIRIKAPRNVPKGTHVARIEDPRGESLMYLVSDGTDKPYRLKVRSPIFVNVSASKHIAKGVRVADVPAIFGTLDMCLGEADR